MQFVKPSLPKMLIVILALFVFQWAPDSFANSGLADSDWTPPTHSVQIRLQQATFDPLLNAPPIPPALTGLRIDEQRTQFYLVQFYGPIHADWRDLLEQTGAEVLDYVPDFAYLVRLHPNRVDAIRRLDETRWVGPYQPAFRLHSDLISALPSARADRLAALVVRAFPGSEAGELATELLAEGVAITEQRPDRGGGAIFRLNAAQASVAALSRLTDVAWIEPEREPLYLNEVARSNLIMGQNDIEALLNLYGANQIVAVGDSGLSTGIDSTVHSDFTGRVFGGTWGPGTCGTWADNDSHGTHVAGSVLGSGYRSGADITNRNYAGSNAGIAPEARLYVWSFCNDFSGLPASPYTNYYGVLRGIDPALRISTNSWGYSSGFGEYNTFTRETDRFVRENPDMVILYAAGNSGVDANSNGVVDPGSIGMPATAKNVIAVGASENLRTSGGRSGVTWHNLGFTADPIASDLLSDNIDGMAAFSSRGPTLSGRLKPDVVAPGTNIVSTRNESTSTGWGGFDEYYLYMGGTSMATPLVAGASAIVREYFQTAHHVTPSAALVKGLLIHGAKDMTPGQYDGTGAKQEVLRRPDNSQGWGRVDLANSLIYSGSRKLWFEDHAGLGTSESHTINIVVTDTAAPLRFTLVWTDHEGTEASHGALVNDLDLIVKDPNGTAHRGNAVLTGGAADRINNIEGVDLLSMAGTYTITVQGFNVPKGPQPFALLVSGDMRRGGELTGTVLGKPKELGEANEPLAYVLVEAVGPVTESVRTDATGAYSLILPVGSYAVTASVGGLTSPDTVTGVTVSDSGPITQDFTFMAADDDGVITCYVAGCEFVEEEVKEVSYSETNDGVTVTVTVTEADGLTHKLTVGNGDPMRAISALPGSTATLKKDKNGQVKVVTRAERDGTRYEVEARSDGSAVHRVIRPDGTVTVAVSQLPSAQTRIEPDGRVVTEVHYGENPRLRVVVLTTPEGNGLVRYERHDSVRNRWEVMAHTVDPISPFEAGHEVMVQQGSPGPIISVTTRVTRDLYF